MEPEALLDNLNNPHLPEYLRRQAYYEVLKINDSSIREKLRSALRKLAEAVANNSIHQIAIRGLGDIQDEQFFDNIQQLLKQADQQIYWEIMHTLVRINASKALPILIDILETDPDIEKRKSSANNLKLIENKTSLEALLKAMKTDENKEVREAAIASLGYMKATEAFDPIIETIKQDEIGNEIISALARIDPEKALPVLIKILETARSDAMRYRAASGLGNIKDRRSLEALLKALKAEDSIDVLEFIPGALGSLGFVEAIDPLIQALEKHKDDAHETVRVEIAEAFGRLKFEQSLQALINILQTDPNELVRRHTIRTLGVFGDKSVETLLVQIILNREEASKVRGEAIEVLDALGLYTPLVREALAKSLRDTAEYYNDGTHPQSVAEAARRVLIKIDEASGIYHALYPAIGAVNTRFGEGGLATTIASSNGGSPTSAFTAGETRTFRLSNGLIPAGATAFAGTIYAYNGTKTREQTAYFRLGAEVLPPLPNSAEVTYKEYAGGMVIAPLTNNLEFQIYSSQATEVGLTILGYYL